MLSFRHLGLGTAAPLLILAASEANAQQRTPPFGPRATLPSQGGQFFGGHLGGRHRHHGKFHGRHFNSFILVEREVPVIIEREVVREVTPAAPPPPPPAPRKPYVIGNSYSSLPGGCMKLIENGLSYYYCGGGEWYRQLGKQYRAIAKP